MGYGNFQATKLSTDIGAADATIKLDVLPKDKTGAVITSGRLVIEARKSDKREIIKYTGVDLGTVSVTGVSRGQGGITAKPHAKGVLVEMNPTAEDWEDALGVPNDIVQKITDTTFDFVVSGGIWTGDSYGSTRNASMTAIVYYIAGVRKTIALVTARSFTASKDTYVDVTAAGAIVYTEVANNAASPALAANSIRIAIIVTGASSIASVGSVNQGEEHKLLPIFGGAFGIAVTDSLGNLICPRDPNRKLLGLRQINVQQGGIGTSAVDLNGMFVPFIAPLGRKVKVTVTPAQWLGSIVNCRANVYILEGATVIKATYADAYGGSQGSNAPIEHVLTPTAGLHTYKLNASTTTGTMIFYADASTQAQIRVELE